MKGGGGGGAVGGLGSEKCSLSKVATRPVIINYGCPKQLLIVEKHQYNFSCSLHLYKKQNKTFLITNLSNVNTKSRLRNQTHFCIHFVFCSSCSTVSQIERFVLSLFSTSRLFPHEQTFLAANTSYYAIIPIT